MKLLLRNHQAPGDILMLTAAVRDLHAAYPGRYQTAVDTSCPELWENNPYITPADQLGAPDRVIDCEYPLIQESNDRPYHFIHAFHQDLGRHLGIHIPVTAFKADLHLSEQEMQAPSPVALLGHAGRYWVLIAGGKYDFTAKWWDPAAMQQVIDHFAGRIQFVQCGQAGHWHPPLSGVINLVDITSIRDLIRLIYHADGVLCPVTFAMHLAAAVPPKPGRPRLKPCVVIAGGREPPHWEMYPGHQYLHTAGALDCCATGGCWKSRCQPVGDGDPKDIDLCIHPVTTFSGLQLCQCMAMITPRKVIDAISVYYEGGTLNDLSQRPAEPRANASADIRVFPKGLAVTIGVGNYAEMAHLAAKELTARTGLQSVVLNDDHFSASGFETPDFLKFRLFDLVDADHLLYFDADMVCLEPWQPQKYFGSEAIVCVRDLLHMGIVEEAGEWSIPLEEYFNSGLLIISRKFHHQWLRLAESLRFHHPTVFRDQTPLNAARCQLNLPAKFLDRRYNWLFFGNSSLSFDTPVVMAHRLLPGRNDLNVKYLTGEYRLPSPRIRINEQEQQRITGMKLILRDEQGNRSSLQLCEGGSILPLANDGQPAFWFVHDFRGRPTLALASDTRILRQFVQALRGVWIPASSSNPERDGARLYDACFGEQGGLTEDNARRVADQFLRSIPPGPPNRCHGRGIVICAGDRYFPSAWVCIRMLRYLGCHLPIELWQATTTELSDHFRRLIQPLGVRCIAASQVQRPNSGRPIDGFALKPFALLHSSFQEVLLLDADNVPVHDPAYLFDSRPYRRTGAAFWPDISHLGPDRAIWRICDVPFRDEPEFESGQILIDKRRCWRALQLTMHFNEQRDFYYSYIYGDKDTFHMAWLVLGQEYALVPWEIRPLKSTMCQHDFDGRRIFQHRNFAKWTLTGDNPWIEGFEYDDLCHQFLDELAQAVGPVTAPPSP